jgi:hypothetical protein
MEATYNDESNNEYCASSGNHLYEQGETMHNKNVTNKDNKPRWRPICK